MKGKKIAKRETYPRDIDPKIEIWCDGGVDTYLAWSMEEVIEVIIKGTGFDRKEVLENLKKVPRSEWSKHFVTDLEDPYESKYSYEDMVCKIIDEGWDGKPDLFCTTEY